MSGPPEMTNICFILALVCAPQSSSGPASLLGRIADRYERLGIQFEHHRIYTRQSALHDGVSSPLTDSETIVNGPLFRQSYLHFDPNYPVVDLAEKYDSRKNFNLINDQINLQFFEKSREARLMAFPPLPTAGLDLIEHLTKAFVVSPGLRPHLDRPLDVFAVSEPLAYRCTWRDLMLPDALKLNGWILVDESEEQIHLARRISDGFKDDIWFLPKTGFSISRREIRPGAGEPILFLYDDAAKVADDLWLPMTCRWKASTGDLVEQRVLHLDFEKPAADRFRFDFPPGTKIIDENANSIRYLAGGESVIDDLVSRAGFVYQLPRRITPATPFAPFRMSLPILSVLIGVVVFRRVWRRLEKR